MKLLSLRFKGFGATPTAFSVQFPPDGTAVIRGKTGCNKTIIFEAVRQAFGGTIPQYRLLQGNEGDNQRSIEIILEVDHHQHKLTYTDTPTEKRWGIEDLVSGVITDLGEKFAVSEFFGAIGSPRLAIDDFFITEQSALRNLASFDQFVRTTSKTYTAMMNYFAILGSLAASYKRDIEAIKRKESKHLDIITVRGLLRNADQTKLDVLIDLDKTEEHYVTLQTSMDELEALIKVAQQLGSDLNLCQGQVQTFQDLIKTKEQNIAECEVKLSSFGNLDEVRACARKTEVGREVELRELDSEVDVIMKKRGMLEVSRTTLQSELIRITTDVEATKTAAQKEKMMIVALGIDPKKLDMYGETQIRAKVAALQAEIAQATRDHKICNEELRIARLVTSFLKKFPEIVDCPCCGTFFGAELHTTINDRASIRQESLATITTLRGEHQITIKKLREFGDVNRRIALKLEKIKMLETKSTELRKQISQVDDQLETNAQERDKVNAKRDAILETLQTEQRLIDAEKLREKIVVAKKELLDLRERVTQQEQEAHVIGEKVSTMPAMSVIEASIADLKSKREALDVETLGKKAELLEIEMRTKELHTREAEAKKWSALSDLAYEKRRICKSYLDYFANLLGKYEEEMGSKRLIDIGEVTGINAISLDKEKGEIVRELGTDRFVQNLIALSTGERVLVSAQVKGESGIWESGGFAVIDANLSKDAMHRCAKMLRDSGCEQVIFIKVGDRDLTVAPL